MAVTETVNQETNNTEVTQERTFTQAELNTIIENRLKKESAKYADYEDLKTKAIKFDEIQENNKTELQKANEKAEKLQKQIDAMNKSNEIRNMREKVAKDTGVPINLLTADTEEACIELANAILEYKNDNSILKYPSVKDAGEIQNNTVKMTAEAQFEEWLKASLNK